MHARTRSTLVGALGVLLLSGSAAAQTATPASAPADAAAPQRTDLITTDDIKGWNFIRQNAVSNDGRWFATVVSPNEADATLVYRGTAENAAETRVPVGGVGGGAAAFSGDSRWLGCFVAPPRPPAAGTRPAPQRPAGDSADTPAAPAAAAATPAPTAG
jgi:hypothetical protein